MFAAKFAALNWRTDGNYWCFNECTQFDGINYPQYWSEGIITDTLFTIMVIMAIVTTLMTSPIVDVLLEGTSYEKSPVPDIQV
jgi:hypothetical protein